jgi:hypothetical protein
VGRTIDIERNMIRKLIRVGRSLAAPLTAEVVEKFEAAFRELAKH